MSSLKIIGFVCFLLFSQICYAETSADSTQKEMQFATTALITNNGVSVIPIFSLGKPAAIINFTVGRKFTFEPEFRVSLEGKPWSFIYWFRYKLAKTPKFCRLSRSVWVVATESMVARRMMTLYMSGAYSTPSKMYSFL